MALVTDVLIVEVIEEVIIIFVLKGNQTVPNILPLCHGLGLQFAQNTNRMQHQRTPEEIEIFTKNVWDPDKIIIQRLTNCKQIVWIWSALMTFTALLLCQEKRGLIFGSDRSSRSTTLHSSVHWSIRLSVTCLKLSIFIFCFGSDSLQKHSVSIKQAFREHFEHSASTQRARFQRTIRE